MHQGFRARPRLFQRPLSIRPDCNQERIKRRARTKRGSKIINVRVSLLAAQMNSKTDFSIEDNLIDISLLAATACIGFGMI